MNEHEQNELWEKSLRDRLTPGEQVQLDAWLATRPDLFAQWEEEKALCQVIRQLPDAPVSSNFTALVMQAVAQEERAVQRTDAPVTGSFMAWLRQHLVQLTASTAVVALAAVLALQQAPTSTPVITTDSRQEIADQIKVLADVAPVPSVDVLKDYEAIRRLSQVSAEPDLELLAALQ